MKEKKSIQVIQETTHWLAIHKSAGLIVERNPFETPTIESLVYTYLQEKRNNPFLGIIHRLDRLTSGLLLLAKKKSALRHLNEQFSQRQVQKTYLALVEKAPPAPSGIVEHWLYKDQKNKRAIIFEQAGKDRKAVELKYRLLEDRGTQYLLEIQPGTGKFHQIRAQLAAVGCPIVGDEKYGAQTVFGPKAIGLHAWKLRFTDPLNQEKIKLQAPWPRTYS